VVFRFDYGGGVEESGMYYTNNNFILQEKK